MKNYLIVGGSTGIGRELSKQLAAAGHQVFVTYFKNKPEEVEGISCHYMNVLDENLDFTFLPEQVHGFAYCPGNINLKSFARIKPSLFIEDYELQVLGAIKTFQALYPKMKNVEQASVVFFSTVAVQTGFNFHALVASSKGALEGLTKSLAAEFAPKIRVNAIAPSITNTPLAAGIIGTEEKKEASAQRHPLKKVGEPADIANIAEFLLSEKSGWITGQIFHVDGGMSAIKL
jgi:NAD(P)-dependent dehydrogenase (short-subunit alcohol dehydrogenase family)